MDASMQYIQFESERDPEFPKLVAEMSGCDTLERCFQCGTCSGTCPLSAHMDLTPRRIMNLTRAGFKDEVLSSSTVWMCSSCYSCTVECPKEIKITDIMYALKRLAMKERRYPKKFPIPILAREFFAMVRQHGRINENILATKVFLKSQPVKMFKNSGLGINLIKRKRFSLAQDRIRNTAELDRMFGSRDN